MKQETLIKIKESYERLEKKQKKIEKIWDRVDDLEKNPLIKEYLNLKEQIKLLDYKERNLSDSDLLEVCANSYLTYMEDTNDIYVCLGIVFLTEKGIKRKYKRYINLESSNDNKLIPIEQCELFESIHSVVEVSYPTEYKEIQKKFILNAMVEGQDIACQKVLSRRKREKV